MNLMKLDQALTPWLPLPSDNTCFVRCFAGTDINYLANRVALIEKTPRIRVAPYTAENDWVNWCYGDARESDLRGSDPESRKWCDDGLAARNLNLIRPGVVRAYEPVTAQTSAERAAKPLSDEFEVLLNYAATLERGAGEVLRAAVLTLHTADKTEGWPILSYTRLDWNTEEEFTAYLEHLERMAHGAKVLRIPVPGENVERFGFSESDAAMIVGLGFWSMNKERVQAARAEGWDLGCNLFPLPGRACITPRTTGPGSPLDSDGVAASIVQASLSDHALAAMEIMRAFSPAQWERMQPPGLRFDRPRGA